MRKLSIKKVCEHCGTCFTARTTTTRFCSDFCAKRAYKIIKDNKVPTYSIKGKAYYSMSTITSIFRKREENSFPEITECTK